MAFVGPVGGHLHPVARGRLEVESPVDAVPAAPAVSGLPEPVAGDLPDMLSQLLLRHEEEGTPERRGVKGDPAVVQKGGEYPARHDDKLSEKYPLDLASTR